MGLSDTLDQLATVVILASIGVGFWEVGGNIGSISTIVQNALDDPQTFGLGLVMYYIGIDTWTPTIPADSLGIFSFLRYLWWFTDGYLPHYSLWSALLGFVTAFIVTWTFLELSDHSFFGWGLPVAIISFLAGYYVWTLIAWGLMFTGGSMIGFTHEQIYQIWHSSAEATRPPALQLFFGATVAITFPWLLKKFV